jgi:HAD superfamily hydrolase (TIGR01549 family)
MNPFLPVKAIAFDCFGTLVEIQSPSNVYRDIVSAMPKHFQPPARQALMTNPWNLADAVVQMGVHVDADHLAELQARLNEELHSIACFEETLAVLSELKARGYKLALCSNLAQPYAVPVEALVGAFFDAKLWSFEVGATKPDRRIYQALCNQLSLPAEDVLMVGDSHLSDFTGSRAAGLHARHLTRNVPHRRLALNRISSLEDLLRLVK